MLIILGLTIIFFQNIPIIQSINGDLILTKYEKQILSQFRDEVKSVATTARQLENFNLIHFLRCKNPCRSYTFPIITAMLNKYFIFLASNWDVLSAKKKFRKAMYWRLESNIDFITENSKYKEWMKSTFPVILNVTDKYNSPVVFCNFGKWNVRKIAKTGELKELNMYTNFVFEILYENILKQRQIFKDNVSQHLHIIDMNQYNLKTHACFACIPFYKAFVTEYENFYPEMAKKIILINTPKMFIEVLEILRPLFSPATKRDLVIFDDNKDDWMSELLTYIEPSQMPQKYSFNA